MDRVRTVPSHQVAVVHDMLLSLAKLATVSIASKSVERQGSDTHILRFNGTI